MTRVMVKNGVLERVVELNGEFRIEGKRLREQFENITTIYITDLRTSVDRPFSFIADR